MELHKSFFLEEVKVSWWLPGRGNSDLFWNSSFIGFIFSATCLACKEKTLCGRFGFNLCVDNRSCFDKFCLTNDLASRKRKMECRKPCSGDAFALSLHIQRCKHRTNSYPNCIDNGNSSF